jgi:4-hydroxythreonine-4-phosphate dehydrogenase
MNNKPLPIVGISCGDPNGIGIEVILKTLSDKRILSFFTPVIFCNMNLLIDQKKLLGIDLDFIKIEKNKLPIKGKINVVNVWEEKFQTCFGDPSIESGKLSYLSLEASATSLAENKIDVLVTAPINKNNIQNENFEFPGHTDYLAKKFEGKSLMFMVSEDLKVGLVTDHIPIKQVHSNITKDKVKEKFSLIKESLIKDFGVQRPKIAVLSIDPHVGDSGTIGDDDDKILKPALKEISETESFVFGPFSSDSFFGSGLYKKYDAVLAIYHDQGLIPFKTLSFGEGVNYTAGLTKIRTSPDHGTGYDIAGKGLADTTSFKKAIFSAIEILNSRKLNEILNKNPLSVKKTKTVNK